MASREEAHAGLRVAANDLRRVLSMVNRYGDEIDQNLTYQADGHCYGEVYKGFKILVQALYPDDGVPQRAERIIEEMFNSDTDIEETAQYVADMNAPRAGYTTEDIRDDLVKYRAWMRTLADGLVAPAKIAGPDATYNEAKAWLESEIAECLAGLAYRNESEVANG